MDVSETASAAIDIETRRCEQHGEYKAKCYAVLPSGRALWTTCAACAREKQREDEERQRQREAIEARERLERRIRRSCIPQRFVGRTLESFHARTPEQQHALKVAREFRDNFAQHSDAGTTLVFSGRPGTGKSHLACAIAQWLAEVGTWTAMYATARELVRMLRDTWREDSERSESQLLNELIRVGLLVIDEVGVGFGSEAEKTQFFDVIDGRYREQMPTILLTNLDKKGLEDYIGQRAFDRLREGGIWVPFTWDSYRGRRS